MLTNKCEQSLFIQSLIAQDNEESLFILTVKVIVSSSIQFIEKSIHVYVSEPKTHHIHTSIPRYSSMNDSKDRTSQKFLIQTIL